jgi:hypothetical protein
MNDILYNISLIIFFVGIILMVVYITKASNNGFLTYQERLMIQDTILKRLNHKQNIYNYRVSDSYKKMFTEESAWFGYQSFDPSLDKFNHNLIN